MADLARSVAHDVNNALGSMLPLVQEMQVDLRSGIFAADRVCRGPRPGTEVAPGLPPDLRRHADFARNASRQSRDGQVRRAIETASAILNTA